ncbi:beta-1,3-glucan-binding protein-like [Macrosteles quadrilineatus]|uniref:beta-1,3-glucan-binding protein-like n=1 Tax=Macrosteles quadrilineatus TaxID=74068 RepID=UPI0023E340B8|nr:beta-1,3-glucan-binding protein-like [Macrosteles quadrilineatus]
MLRLGLAFVLCLCVLPVIPQIIRVVEVPRPQVQRVNRNLPETRYNNVENQVILEFLKPRGLGIFVPGPYPRSNVYKLKFHVNINKEFEGWKVGEWNEGIIVRYGARWQYTFPDIQVKEGDVIYYWIEAEGDDWEKGYKGKYQVGQQTSLDNSVPPGCSRLSLTTYSGGRKACGGEKLIKSYSQVDQKYLREESPIFMRSVKQIGGLSPEEEFTTFTSENIVINRTHTAIFPGLLEIKYGPSFVNAKNFTIQGCTSDNPELCSASAVSYLILPPVLSGRHSSEKSFSFRYGVVEVTAKLPQGDWVVPELWLLPKDRAYNWTDGSTAKIVMAMSRGNARLWDVTQGRDLGNRVLYAGVQRRGDDVTFTRELRGMWSDQYHRFKLVWTPERIQFLVDGDTIGSIQADQGLDPSAAPFDQEFYLVFGVHVGGNKDFPDTIDNKPWRNFEPKNKLKFWQARSQWQPSWGINSALMIRDLTVTAL